MCTFLRSLNIRSRQQEILSKVESQQKMSAFNLINFLLYGIAAILQIFQGKFRADFWYNLVSHPEENKVFELKTSENSSVNN